VDSGIKCGKTAGSPSGTRPRSPASLDAKAGEKPKLLLDLIRGERVAPTVCEETCQGSYIYKVSTLK
jgi:hypothetical protein